MADSDVANVVFGLLSVMAVLEVMLFVCRGALLQVGQTRGLERQIEELQAERQEALERNKEREPELAAAKQQAEDAQASLRRANTQLAESRQPRDVLVHRLGEPPGPMFRAGVAKTLATPPDASQVMLWSYKNFVDVWAPDAAAAVEIASHSFAEKAGYMLGPFQPFDDRPAPAPDAAPEGG